jgi:transcription elongation factor GreA
VNETAAPLAQAVDQGDYDTLESLWLDLLDADALPAEDLADVLRRLVARGEGPRAVDLALALAPELVEADRHAEALPLLRAVAPAASDSEEVRNLLLACYRALYREEVHLDACIDEADLLSADDIASAMATLDRLLSYQVGDYFYHPSGWGAGPIVEFDILSASAVIDFEHKPGHTVPLRSIEEIFEPLAPEDFRVLRRTDPERLKRMAREEPVRLVRIILAAFEGRRAQRQLRDLLAGKIIAKDAWSRWWSRLRPALTRDPHIELAKGSNPTIILRDEALTYEDEMRERFESLKDLDRKVALLREYLDHRAKGADAEAFLLPAARELAEAIGQPAGDTATQEPAGQAAAFEAAVLLDNLGLDVDPHPSPAELLATLADPLPLLNELNSGAARRSAFELLRERTEAPQALARRVLLEGPRELWSAAAAELPPSGESPSLAALARGITDEPKRNLTLFAWVARQLLEGRWPVPADSAALFDTLLTEGDALARRKADQFTRDQAGDDAALTEIRQTLRRMAEKEAAETNQDASQRGERVSPFGRLVQQISEAEAARLLFRVRQSSALSPTMARTLERFLVRAYPRLLAEEAKPTAIESEFIYATAEGIARRRKEFEHLVNTLIPENAKDIGRAAALGDISDNADFRAATQERDRLNALRGHVTDEMNRARPITPDMVHTDQVSIGSRVTVEDTESGEQHTYTLLGPWDADADRGIIAYAAPLAQSLLRHKVGEEVTFEHAGQKTHYRILNIENGLENAPD